MKYKEIEEIKKDFFFIGLLQHEAEFVCFNDGIFSYYIYDDSFTHEISIINNNVTFMKKERVVDLLDLKNTIFLEHTIYDTETEQEIVRKTFRICDQNDCI